MVINVTVEDDAADQGGGNKDGGGQSHEEEEKEPEPERMPGAPAGIGAGGGEGKINVSWAAPSDQGNPPLTGYSVQYREGTSGSWLNAEHSGTGTSTTITGLSAGQYQVQVAAINDAGTGPYKTHAGVWVK
ncbi:MAG: fibronectin type III domain-containing protein [Actinomycetia bacterium]|nr:fibronectin type III domain-containing protein [Actinomycetes bacterium]